jgi:hypothetical protein
LHWSRKAIEAMSDANRFATSVSNRNTPDRIQFFPALGGTTFPAEA